jgi:hypothetical protein
VADGRERLFARPDAPHRVHDLLLVTAFAAGDVAPAERAQAQALVDACADCAALVADLRAIERATATLPAERRPRDFRLTPADAERLRPHSLRGRFRVLARPRLERAYPVATGLTALGITGLLVAGLSFSPGGSASTPAQEDAAGAAPMQLEAPPSTPPDLHVTSGGAATPPASTRVDAAAPAPTAVAERDAPNAETTAPVTPLLEPRTVIAVLSALAAIAGLGLFAAARRQRRDWR